MMTCGCLMSDGVQFSILGLDELRKRIGAVSEEVETKAANAAARSAARLIAMEAYHGALKLDDPKSAAEIARNIWAGGKNFPGVKKKAKRYSPEDGVAYRIGVMGGAGGTLKKDDPSFSIFPGGDTRHWRFWEFGSENTKAQPFLRPALDRSITPAINEFVSEYEKAINRGLRKVTKARAARSSFQQRRRNVFGLAD
jgi:HK97 gp10 family phage protein